MKCMSLALLAVFGVSAAVAITVSGGRTAFSDAGNASANAAARTARVFPHRAGVSIPSKKAKRQVVRVRSGVSKAKVLQPPLSLRHNRAPQQFSRYPATFRGDAPWMPPSRKPHTGLHFPLDSPFLYEPHKIKRNLKKPNMAEGGPEDLRPDEPQLELNEDNRWPKRVNKHRSVVKIKRKRPKQNILGEYLANYEGDGRMSHEYGGSFHSSQFHFPPNEESHPFHPYDSAGSTTHAQHLPPPSSLPPHPHPDKNHVPALKIKNLPTKGRQVHSMFSQQYTTHNPHVTTNFGLAELLHPHTTQHGMKPSPVDPATPHDSPLPAASVLAPSALPVNPPAMQVIQPPQFRDVAVTRPSHPSRLMSGESHHNEETSSQKATIRDILEQDCPAHDAKGYCDSPPRYPMQQIKNVVEKCADLMDAMNTQPLEDPQQVLTFAKRTLDVGGSGKANGSTSIDLGLDDFSTWSRSATGGFAACTSKIELTEPGYAREVNSGRWFVIVQHPDTTIQRIATDTCRSPGKPCGGLSELKCPKVNALPPKATSCIQRHTNQRLISWDPESPEDCPRMRVFRFPSACTCHLDVL